VVVVDANNTRLSPAYEPPSTLVRYATGSDVESVVVAGRVVVDKGRVLTLDEAGVIEEALALGDKLGEALAPRRYRPLRYTTAHVT
jgi:cytosine/adenosine deaminase-related metal-dependent hydrolase